MRTGWMIAAGLFCAIAATPAIAEAAEPVKVTIDGASRSAPVTKYEYGMFIEPIGGLVARTLWAEMLDDRKFYYPVVAPALDTPPPLNAEGRPGVTYRKWRPVGGDDAVVMDTKTPYVGTQSPRVAVDRSVRRGISQSGIGLAKGKRYDGYVLLSGDPDAQIEVTLVWGPGPSDRQTVALPSPSGDWKRSPFSFTPTADASDARLEITGLGSGSFRIGAVSLMPSDNIRGWRADATTIARSLNSGMWRLPGGNFLSNWDWHGALGPRDLRAPMFDHAWSAMQPNDIGLDEWMDLTRIIGVEPYVTVDAGLGDANSAAEEVEYLNGPSTSVWGARRAANGHPEPYGVKFWNIGNEPYGWWQIGKTSLDYFMIKHNAFAKAMRAVDPTITLIGSGAMPDQLHPRDVQENASLESIAPKFGTEQDWTGGLLAKAWGNFDGVSEHWYDRPEKRPNAPADAELMEYARAPSNQVRMKAEEWKIYERRFPAMKDRKIFLSIDEYAYFGEVNLKSALAYAMVLQEMLRHTDFLTMAAFTTGASTMDITPTGSTLNSTGAVFKFYGEHFGAGAIPVAVLGGSEQPEPRYPVGYAHPKVRAGSPTYPLDVVAALGPDGKTLRIGVVNATFDPQPVNLDLKALAVRGAGRRWVLTGTSLEAANKVGAPAGVTVTASAAPRPGPRLVAPPLSATVFEFPVSVGVR
ncbi:MAG: alpha-N-arabinofuranosidase [Caulobacter sp.]|nr:alpha-N-arabinofuranosidase [Caulobacter sp.]